MTLTGETLLPGASLESSSLQEPVVGACALTARAEPGERPYVAVKCVVDAVAAAAAIALLSPLFFLIAIAIKIDSSGPILFHQRRVGRHGRVFTIHKFRTMYTSAPPNSYKVRNESAAITKLGRYLRVTGLDELPQLWNVLCGEMSLIGPRPELESIAIELGITGHMRHSVRPGITGWWQIHHRDGQPLHHNLGYDVEYINRMSAALDGWIAIRTFAYVVWSLITALIRR